MLVIPAIDLKDGCVVRYVQGKLNKKVYSRDPVKTGLHWIKQGARMLHVIDLDGAFTGTAKNIRVVKEIVKQSNVPVQFGGGVRTLDTVKELIDSGVRRVILGTKAVEDTRFLAEVFKLMKERVIVSLDAKAEHIMVRGWKESSKKIKLIDFALSLKEMGFKEVIYTDTLKDGTLTGPNIKGIKALLKSTGLKVVASGGISELDDIYKLSKLKKDGLSGVIVGKALYEGKFTLVQALKIA